MVAARYAAQSCANASSRCPTPISIHITRSSADSVVNIRHVTSGAASDNSTGFSPPATRRSTTRVARDDRRAALARCGATANPSTCHAIRNAHQRPPRRRASLSVIVGARDEREVETVREMHDARAIAAALRKPRGEPSTISIARTPGSRAGAEPTLLRFPGIVSIDDRRRRRNAGEHERLLVDVAEICGDQPLYRRPALRTFTCSPWYPASIPWSSTVPSPRPGVPRDAALAAFVRSMVGDVRRVVSGTALPMAHVFFGPTGSSVVRILCVSVEVDGNHAGVGSNDLRHRTRRHRGRGIREKDDEKQPARGDCLARHSGGVAA